MALHAHNKVWQDKKFSGGYLTEYVLHLQHWSQLAPLGTD
jgi:hypothetical protein